MKACNRFLLKRNCEPSPGFAQKIKLEPVEKFKLATVALNPPD